MSSVAVRQLERRYFELFPDEAIQVLDSYEDDALIECTNELAYTTLLDVVDRFSPVRAQVVFAGLQQQKQYELLEQAPPRISLKLLLPLKKKARKKLFAGMSNSLRRDLERLIAFPPDSAATLMDSAIGTIRSDVTVAEAIHQIRLARSKPESSVIVVDAENHFVGHVNMQDLVLAQDTDRIVDLVYGGDICANVTFSSAAVVELVEEFDDVLPIVDESRKLLGVVRDLELRDAVEEDATASVQRMVGSAEEKALSRSGASIRFRLPWLYVNLATAFLAASVVALFDNLIATFTALAVLLPVVAGQSGNSGSQAMAVAIRGLALREISLRDWFRVASKETFVGFVNGLAIAAVCALAVYVWSGSLGLTSVIFIAMIAAMVIAGLAGSLVPIVLTRFGQDPATASSIILTTVTDVAGFFVFLGVASLLAFAI